MPSRRAVLTGAGGTLAAGLAGCRSDPDAEPPAGSLRVHNRDDVLPHALRMVVTDIGTGPSDTTGLYTPPVTGDPTGISDDLTLTTTAHLDPATSRLYESVFTEPIWYAVTFTVDGQMQSANNGRVAFTPARKKAPELPPRGRFLEATVDHGGGFGFAISATDNPGSFEGLDEG